MARYKLQIKPSAAKELEAVGQKKDRQRIAGRIETLAEMPRPRDCEKLSGHRDLYRVREGSYRIVYSIDEQNVIVHVIKIGHRKEIYRLLG